MRVTIGNEEFLDMQELSKLLGVSGLTLRRYIKAGKLQASKIGVRWFVTGSALKKFVERSEVNFIQDMKNE